MENRARSVEKEEEIEGEFIVSTQVLERISKEPAPVPSEGNHHREISYSLRLTGEAKVLLHHEGFLVESALSAWRVDREQDAAFLNQSSGDSLCQPGR